MTVLGVWVENGLAAVLVLITDDGVKPEVRGALKADLLLLTVDVVVLKEIAVLELVVAKDNLEDDDTVTVELVVKCETGDAVTVVLMVETEVETGTEKIAGAIVVEPVGTEAGETWYPEGIDW